MGKQEREKELESWAFHYQTEVTEQNRNSATIKPISVKISQWTHPYLVSKSKEEEEGTNCIRYYQGFYLVLHIFWLVLDRQNFIYFQWYNYRNELNTPLWFTDFEDISSFFRARLLPISYFYCWVTVHTLIFEFVCILQKMRR